MKPQTTLPNSGNPFYNTTDIGGYSWCIKGKPTQDGLNVLDNCVGWACGRFNEIIGSMQYPQLNCNAENFIDRALSIGLTYQSEPCLGGIMVWEGKGDLAGHVAVVEQLNSDGSVLTSDSGYKHFAFDNFTRARGNGNWGLNNNFEYLGCIINPANPQPEPPTPPTPTDFPFQGVVHKGSVFYNEYGGRYKYPAKSDFQVEVLDEVNGRYKVYATRLNPNVVYTDTYNVTKIGGYPFNAVVKKGTVFYNQYGQRYKYPAQSSFTVEVRGEANGRYQVYATRLNPNVVYCNKQDVII